MPIDMHITQLFANQLSRNAALKNRIIHAVFHWAGNASSYYHLFPNLKRTLAREQFSTDDELRLLYALQTVFDWLTGWLNCELQNRGHKHPVNSAPKSSGSVMNYALKRRRLCQKVEHQRSALQVSRFVERGTLHPANRHARLQLLISSQQRRLPVHDDDFLLSLLLLLLLLSTKLTAVWCVTSLATAGSAVTVVMTSDTRLGDVISAAASTSRTQLLHTPTVWYGTVLAE